MKNLRFHGYRQMDLIGTTICTALDQHGRAWTCVNTEHAEDVIITPDGQHAHYFDDGANAQHDALIDYINEVAG